MSQAQPQTQPQPEKPVDPYQKYKDFKWQNPDQFKNGPIDDETRKCRDCICCIIFLVLFALCVVVAGFGFKKGKPSQLFYFYDDDGKACGHDEGYEDYPYLYFTSVVDGLKSFDTNKILNAVCVKSCPAKKVEKTVGTQNVVSLDCHVTSKTTSCNIPSKNFYESKVFIEKICFPRTTEEIEFDSSKQVLVEIYDPETGETFKKVLDKNADNVQYVGTRLYIAQEAIDGKNGQRNWCSRYIPRLFALCL